MSLHRELARILGPEHVLAAPDSAAAPYNYDASRRPDRSEIGQHGRADAVVIPGSAQEVAEVVGWCYAHDMPIVPRGGGTGLTGGAVPTTGGVVCSLERLTRVREVEPGLWRMEVEAGVTTAHVHRLARENGLMFAPDPGACEQSQIGGNVATNAGGPHALKYGVTGAWVAGLEVVLAPGELVRIGGWARKDVAGYDLRSLLIGSEGTLGVITAVRLRLLPAPESTAVLVVFLPSLASGCEAILEITAGGLRPSALEFLDGATLKIVAGGYPGGMLATTVPIVAVTLARSSATPGRAVTPDRAAETGVPPGAGCALLVEVDGSFAEVGAQRAELLELLDGSALAIHEPADPAAVWRWRDGFNGLVTAERGAKVSEDVSLPIEHLREGIERFIAIAASHGLRACAWGHGGEGNVHATVLVDPADPRELEAGRAVEEELFALVVGLGGSIAAEHGIGRLKSGRLASQWDSRAVELHEQIKRVFDPKNLLNPGAKQGRLSGG